MNFKKLHHVVFGPPKDIFQKDTRKHIALVAFMAWVGLGADGLSSSAYGPAEAYLALADHTELAIFLAIMTAITVFIIAMAYTQVIDLFPDGGGGYRVASRLIHPKAGLVSGSALIIDYVLTLTISVAGGVDAVFSMLPVTWQPYKVPVGCLIILLLMYFNLRGMKESINILMPIFLGFVISHLLIVVYGIAVHADGLPHLVPKAVDDANEMGESMGYFVMLALFLKAFSLGGGTYTGLEAVSNGVSTMAEPRAKTGKITMYYVAASLAFMAAGIICLYLLWQVTPVEGKTLNAVTYEAIIGDWVVAGLALGAFCVFFLLITEAGLLFVAANAGYIAGPLVLANMGADKWMPHFFSSLSSRLVTKNGILLIAMAGLAILLITNGDVSTLVVLYSINVFMTFSLTMLGLCIHWIKSRRHGAWVWKFTVAALGLLVTSTILLVTVVEKFESGGWITIVTTSLLILLGYRIKKRYTMIDEKIHKIDELFAKGKESQCTNPPQMDHTQPTAVLIMHETTGSGMHTLLWILRLFPNIFKNFVFVSVGEVDNHSFAEEGKFNVLRKDVKNSLKYCVDYCHNHGFASTSFLSFGTDKLEKMTELTDQVAKEFPRAVFFTSKLLFDDENMFNQLLHNQNAYILQRRLHNKGFNMIILPMKV